MTRSDFKLLFTALGFLAVIMKGDDIKKSGASRALDLAGLIEDFCRTTRPGLIPQHVVDNNFEEIDQLIENLKDNLEHKHEAQLPDDLLTLHRVYHRLLQRHRVYASDDLIADEVLHLLEEENRHAKEANMQIAMLQGDENIFEPCERMASAIVEFLKNNGSCHPDDLKAAGFSEDEISRHWRMAYGLAKVELNWMDA